MAEAQMVGGPDDGMPVPIDPFQTTIEIHQGNDRYLCPIRRGRIYWNERRKL